MRTPHVARLWAAEVDRVEIAKNVRVRRVLVGPPHETSRNFKGLRRFPFGMTLAEIMAEACSVFITMRAPRFPLQLSVSYRPLGHSEWRQGRTENISASGVLVQDSFPVQVDTCVEFKLALASKPANGGRQISSAAAGAASVAKRRTAPAL